MLPELKRPLNRRKPAVLLPPGGRSQTATAAAGLRRMQEDGEQRWAFRKFERITLFFTSDDEKDSFEKYVELHLGELKSRIEASNEFEYIATESETKTAEYKRSLRTAIELKAMLEEFRQSCQV